MGQSKQSCGGIGNFDQEQNGVFLHIARAEHDLYLQDILSTVPDTPLSTPETHYQQDNTTDGVTQAKTVGKYVQDLVENHSFKVPKLGFMSALTRTFETGYHTFGKLLSHFRPIALRVSQTPWYQS